LFVEKGYDATGLTELASRIGLLKGSLYHYIATKDDLLFAIIDHVHRTSLSNMVDWQPADGSVHLKIRMFIKVMSPTSPTTSCSARCSCMTFGPSARPAGR